MRKIRIGIIGLGRMGITHFSILNTHQNVQIVAVAEPSGLVRSFMGKYLSGVKLFKYPEDLLKSAEVDAIIICTPPGFHHKIIKLAGEKGIHVFCEKPFTTKWLDAMNLTNDFIRKGLVNQVGYVNRYNDVFIKTKEFVDSGILGRIIRFRSEMFSCTVVKPEEGEGWRSSTEQGGGVVYEMASHAIDLVNFLLGKPDKAVGSVLNKVYSKNVDDIVSSTFLYNNGITGSIYVNWSDSSYRKPANKIEIAGTSGKLLADQHSLKLYLIEADLEKKLNKGWNTFYITDVFRPVPFYVRGNEFTRQLYEFVDVINGTRKVPLCTFEEGAKTLQVIENIFEDFNRNSKI